MFTTAVSRTAPGLLAGAYKALEVQMRDATAFAATWLGYQALWDTDVSAIASDIVRTGIALCGLGLSHVRARRRRGATLRAGKAC